MANEISIADKYHYCCNKMSDYTKICGDIYIGLDIDNNPDYFISAITNWYSDKINPSGVIAYRVNYCPFCGKKLNDK